MTTYRVTSNPARDMFLGHLPADAVQDYNADTEASSETATVGEFEIADEYAGLFEHTLDNEAAVIEWERKDGKATKRQWTYEETVIEPGVSQEDVDLIVGSGDLQEEAWEALQDGQTVHRYLITLYDEAGIQSAAEGAEGLYIPDAGRICIAWGANADWMDTTGDVEADIEMWVNDNEAYNERN